MIGAKGYDAPPRFAIPRWPARPFIQINQAGSRSVHRLRKSKDAIEMPISW
jgi:hypothetical protein